MLDEMDQEMLDADKNGEITLFPEGDFDAVEAIYSNLTMKAHGNVTDIHKIIYDVDILKTQNRLEDYRLSFEGD